MSDNKPAAIISGGAQEELFSRYRYNAQGKASRAQALAAVRTLIGYIGDDPERPGLAETPERVLKAWERDWGAGYQNIKPDELVKLFSDEPEAIGVDYGRPHGERPIVMVSNLNFFSTCEHHMAPFFGYAHIAYIPSDKGLLGLSKLARVLDHFSRRLQVQERLTNQIADFLETHVSPDIAVYMQARHMCMISRGVKQPHAQTITSALRGAFFVDLGARAEFFALAKQAAPSY